MHRGMCRGEWRLTEGYMEGHRGVFRAMCGGVHRGAWMRCVEVGARECMDICRNVCRDLQRSAKTCAEVPRGVCRDHREVHRDVQRNN